MRFAGTYTALVTPFRNQEVDYDTFRALVRRQIAAGIDGIVPMGTTGETPTLTDGEMRKLLGICVEEAGGKCAVICGTGTNSTRSTIERTQNAKDLGADAVLVVTPYYSKPSNNGIFEHFRAITESVDIPVVVYNIASRSARNIDTPTMKRLAGLKNIVAVKEASGSIEQMTDVLREVPEIDVLAGDDAITYPLMALGGTGVISVTSNLFPGKMRALAHEALAGNWLAARKIHLDLVPVFQALFIETNPQPVKAAMAHRGLLHEEYRLPITGMEPANRQKLLAVLETSGYWE